MDNSTIYKSITKSKDGYDIPVLKNNKSLHSIYSPIKEASTFGNIKPTKNLFTIILGLGGGYHIQSFAEKNPEHFIMIIENSIKDISFLSSIECVKNLKQKRNILISTIENLYQNILKNYSPVIHNGINILSNRQWIEFDHQKTNLILETINTAIETIGKDFSVQAHFGFIWQKNIISNLKILSTLNFQKIEIPNNKTAAIIAAGPSLDYTISKIKKDRNKYFIISTDTGLQVIKKHNLNCDAVISIDGQNISYKHFIGLKNFSNTIFIFDLQSNFNAVNFATRISNKIIFTCSNHPFSIYANINGSNKNQNEEFINNENTFLNLSNGAGTVTIAAIDFAKKCGFNQIEVFGADFSYPFNKPYAKGTYLDSIYRYPETKISPAENDYINLLFRTEISKSFFKNKYKNTTKIQTELLTSYEQTFLQWIRENNYTYNYEDFIYNLKGDNKFSNTKSIKINFNYEKFIHTLKNDLKKINDKLNFDKNKQPFNNVSINDLSNIEITLLPYISYLKNKYKNIDYNECLKLAMTKILQYT